MIRIGDKTQTAKIPVKQFIRGGGTLIETLGQTYADDINGHNTHLRLVHEQMSASIQQAITELQAHVISPSRVDRKRLQAVLESNETEALDILQEAYTG